MKSLVILFTLISFTVYSQRLDISSIENVTQFRADDSFYKMDSVLKSNGFLPVKGPNDNGIFYKSSLNDLIEISVDKEVKSLFVTIFTHDEDYFSVLEEIIKNKYPFHSQVEGVANFSCKKGGLQIGKDKSLFFITRIFPYP